MNHQSLYFTGAKSVEIRDEPLNDPQAGQVCVRAVLSGISAGTEMLFYRGQAPSDLPLDVNIESLAREISYPLKYGYSCVGRVTTLGPGVSPEWQDRLVFMFNPHESHFITDPSSLIPLPKDITPEQAIFLPNMETAVNLVMDGHPMIGEQVAVIGQGIVGLLVTALLAEFSLASLVTLDRFPTRRDWSVKLGAQTSLDPSEPNNVQHALRLLAGDRPYPAADLVYELSGSPDALNTAIALAGFDGRTVVGSWYGTKRAAIDLGGYFHRSRIQLISSQVSTIKPEYQGRWSKARRFDLAWQMIAKIRPECLITHRFPLIEAHQAYRLLDQDPAVVLQVVLTYE